MILYKWLRLEILEKRLKLQIPQDSTNSQRGTRGQKKSIKILKPKPKVIYEISNISVF